MIETSELNLKEIRAQSLDANEEGEIYALATAANLGSAALNGTLVLTNASEQLTPLSRLGTAVSFGGALIFGAIAYNRFKRANELLIQENKLLHDRQRMSLTELNLDKITHI